jgi:hypothetical protein
MHIAALIGRFRQSLAQRRPQPGVVVGDDELDAVQTARLEVRGLPAKPSEFEPISRGTGSHAVCC